MYYNAYVGNSVESCLIDSKNTTYDRHRTEEMIILAVNMRLQIMKVMSIIR